MTDLTDRCDASPSGSEAAPFTWTLPGVGQLRLCNHHSNKHAEALNTAGWLLTSTGGAER